jgi:hypothetical protein
MDETIGNEILQYSLGHNYYTAGRKPADKQYFLLNPAQQNDNNLIEKAALRLKRNDPFIKSLGLAHMASNKARDLQYDSWIATIDVHPVSHNFCVADYRPHAGSPICVQDMLFDGECGGAWVIDPWMNISCRFDAYPRHARAKLSKWADQGKHILRQEEGLDRTLVAHDPSDPIFRSHFFTGPLKFHRFLAAQPRRFEAMKAANGNA